MGRKPSPESMAWREGRERRGAALKEPRGEP